MTQGHLSYNNIISRNRHIYTWYHPGILKLCGIRNFRTSPCSSSKTVRQYICFKRGRVSTAFAYLCGDVQACYVYLDLKYHLVEDFLFGENFDTIIKSNTVHRIRLTAPLLKFYLYFILN